MVDHCHGMVWPSSATTDSISLGGSYLTCLRLSIILQVYEQLLEIFIYFIHFLSYCCSFYWPDIMLHFYFLTNCGLIIVCDFEANSFFLSWAKDIEFLILFYVIFSTKSDFHQNCVHLICFSAIWLRMVVLLFFDYYLWI